MVGFPHSEILGSKLIRSSPRLIAAYYVLHRLHTPRHPLDALKTLDRSHYQCPQHHQPHLALVFQLKSPSSGRSFFRRITASVLIGQIKKNHSSRTATVPPRGCRVKQTVLCLFTMSKDPVVVTSQCQHNQTCSLFLRRISFRSFRWCTERSLANFRKGKWWSQTGSNRRHPACKAGALPAELWPHHGDLPAKTGGPG